jgi:hypothetical protein
LYHTHTFSQTANQLTTVNNVSNYSNLNSINSPFKGNIAYVVEDSTIYQYDGNEWVHFCRDRVKNPFYLGKETKMRQTVLHLLVLGQSENFNQKKSQTSVWLF